MGGKEEEKGVGEAGRGTESQPSGVKSWRLVHLAHSVHSVYSLALLAANVATVAGEGGEQEGGVAQRVM